MKKLSLVVGLSLGVTCFYGQDYYSYVSGQKRFLEVSTTKMFVKSETLNIEYIKNELQCFVLS